MNATNDVGKVTLQSHTAACHPTHDLWRENGRAEVVCQLKPGPALPCLLLQLVSPRHQVYYTLAPWCAFVW